jgi:hypothetical protein
MIVLLNITGLILSMGAFGFGTYYWIRSTTPSGDAD